MAKDQLSSAEKLIKLKKKRTKYLVHSIVSGLASVLVIGVFTLSWFVNNKEVAAEGMTASIFAPAPELQYRFAAEELVGEDWSTYDWTDERGRSITWKNLEDLETDFNVPENLKKPGDSVYVQVKASGESNNFTLRRLGLMEADATEEIPRIYTVKNPESGEEETLKCYLGTQIFTTLLGYGDTVVDDAEPVYLTRQALPEEIPAEYESSEPYMVSPEIEIYNGDHISFGTEEEAVITFKITFENKDFSQNEYKKFGTRISYDDVYECCKRRLFVDCTPQR